MKRKMLFLSAIAGAAVAIWVVMPEWLRDSWKPK
jgi:hypothetical protein